MNTDEALQSLLPSFRNYYNVNTDSPEAPFAAEAVFSSHNEQYYLVKAAKVADIDTNEYVYFAKCELLTTDELTKLDETAWLRGSSQARPGYNHRSTDVTLFILSDRIDDEAAKLIRKMRHYKSYKWGFHGWSNYRLVAIECSSGKAFYNHQGRSLKKLVRNIIK